MKMHKIQKRVPWTAEHNQQAIALYFKFEMHQAKGEAYQKAGPIRELAEKQGRSPKSVEAKLMNVSGCLKDLKKTAFIVKGLAPLTNYNTELFEAVKKYVG
jgi:hypothetical protein